jgi:GSH-dependent disulfide-bond oxidoreductase
MIELYSWPTPNGHKVHIMLEELGVPYDVHAINIDTGNQFKPEFLAISPNNKMPAIIDTEGPDGKPIAVFESGAILLYLADKHGTFMPTEPRAYWEAMKWLMFQMGGVGPMFGQANHFLGYAPEKIPYAMNRYRNEAGRLYGVMDTRLEGREYFCDDYTIVDMAIYPWAWRFDRREQNPNDFPNVKRWCETMLARPGVARGMQVLVDQRKDERSPEEWKLLFGDQRALRG